MLRRLPPLLALAPVGAAAQEAPAAIDPASTAWMLCAAALVLLMTPALAFFYGGLVRGKNVLNTMMMSLASLGVVALGWVLVGYSLAFDGGGPLVGGLGHAFLAGVGLEASGDIPHLLFAAYQGTFVIITTALISGAVVERMRFGPYLAFVTVWSLAVYAPVAHWVWAEGGWIFELGALDFAGGTVVHVNAAAAAVVAALVVGPRKDYARQAILPHNVPFVILGAGLLWFGWFGFNAGSALGANAAAALAFANTLFAPAAALAAWTALDVWREGRPTAVGAATAIVVGLVAVTPAAGFVGPLGAVAIGAIAAVPSYAAVRYRTRTRLDDSLDVLAAHGLGGAVGALLTGVFASAAWGGADGALFGNVAQLGPQALSVLAVAAYSAAGSFVILKAIGLVTELRADAQTEGRGLDVAQHGEGAYGHGDGAILVLGSDAAAPAEAPAPAPTPAYS